MEASGIKLSVGQIIGGTTRALQVHAGPFAVYVVGLAMLSSISDLTLGEGVSRGAEQIVSFVAGFFLYRVILKRSGMLPADATGGGFGAYLGAAILSGLGGIIGLVFLILPGLILLSRWSIAAPIVIAEDRSATQAMRDSWEATRASQWAIVLVYFLYFLVSMTIVGGVVAATVGFTQELTDTADMSIGTVAITNLLTQAFGVIAFAISLAILQGLQRGTGQLEDVFG